MIKRSILFSSFLLLAMQAIYPQSLTVSGKVTFADDGGNATGVYVVVQNTAKGTVTNMEGEYSIETNMGDTLLFSFIGYYTQKIAVNNSRHDISLIADTTMVFSEHAPVVQYGFPKSLQLKIKNVEHAIPLSKTKREFIPSEIQTDSVKEEYEAIVIEPGYETFLATQPSVNFYSESTLKIRNAFLVNEWNYRCNDPMRYNPQIYEAKIDYDPKTDYGMEVEYKLYMFFRYMDKKYGLGLENR